MIYSEEERAKRLEGWRESGKSAWAYSKEHGLNLKTLKSWIMSENETKHNFVEVPSKPISVQAIQSGLAPIRYTKLSCYVV